MHFSFQNNLTDSLISTVIDEIIFIFNSIDSNAKIDINLLFGLLKNYTKQCSNVDDFYNVFFDCSNDIYGDQNDEYK